MIFILGPNHLFQLITINHFIKLINYFFSTVGIDNPFCKDWVNLSFVNYQKIKLVGHRLVCKHYGQRLGRVYLESTVGLGMQIPLEK